MNIKLKLVKKGGGVAHIGLTLGKKRQLVIIS